jgi:hypothetical protein
MQQMIIQRYTTKKVLTPQAAILEGEVRNKVAKRGKCNFFFPISKPRFSFLKFFLALDRLVIRPIMELYQNDL